jgi:hypothetical protein
MKKIIRIIVISMAIIVSSHNGRGEYIQFCKEGNTGVCVTGAGGWEAFKCDPTTLGTKDCSGTYLKEVGNNPN